MWGAIFPGQGSQTVGMGRYLFENFTLAKQSFEEASDTLGLNFKKLCFDGPEADLQLTENTQPALLLVSTATFSVVMQNTDLQIAAGAGHSVGEYAAAVATGSLRLTDALKAVRLRGQAMQRAVPVGQGGMVAVLGLTDEQVRKLCLWVEESSGFRPLQPANFNAPGQVVISGSSQAIAWLRENARTDIFAPETPRMKLIPLAVSAPFHCEMMKPAQDEMQAHLAELEFRDAKWPVVQNVTAAPVTSGIELRKNLVEQVSGAVQWTGCMRGLSGLGVSRLIEFGSGKVLSGLAKKISPENEVAFNLNSLEDIHHLELALKKASSRA
jgi:[acyl-carrier-protein] S-malonyltransferase